MNRMIQNHAILLYTIHTYKEGGKSSNIGSSNGGKIILSLQMSMSPQGLEIMWLLHYSGLVEAFNDTSGAERAC